MLLVRDGNGKIRCAKCYKTVEKVSVVKDRFLPTGLGISVPSSINHIGVCASCHKERLKHKLVFPDYWKHLSPSQMANLTATMRHSRSMLLLKFDEPEISARLHKL